MQTEERRQVPAPRRRGRSGRGSFAAWRPEAVFVVVVVVGAVTVHHRPSQVPSITAGAYPAQKNAIHDVILI